MCDTLAAVGAATSSGGVLFAKNSDRPFDEAQYLECVPAARHEPGSRVRLTYVDIEQAPETHAVLLSKPHWIWGAEIGANSHGLVIGNEALPSNVEASLREGIIGMDYLRLALERARTVDEGIEVITSLLREYGQSGNCSFKGQMAYHNSFLLADPRGAQVLETIDREWAVASVESHYAISNAITIESLKARDDEESKTRSGRHRQARAAQLLAENRGALNPAYFFRILRDHVEGRAVPGRAAPRICAHTRDAPLGQTTASWVAELNGDLHVHWVTATAAPCTGLFKPLLLELGLFPHGPAPGANVDNESLWWRHEQLRLYLDQQSSAVQSAFDEARIALETSFLNEMATCPAVTDEKSAAEARRIVTNCWSRALDFETRWWTIARANREV